MTVAEISEFSAGGHPAAPRLEEAFSVISPATAILFDVKMRATSHCWNFTNIGIYSPSTV
jgi:hypothetical protein